MQVMLLLAVTACVSGHNVTGQVAQSTPTSIKGVKIIRTSSDDTGKRSITFMNDSTSDITAFNIVSITTHSSGSMERSFRSRDLFTAGWRSVELRHRPFLGEIPYTGDVLHPGQTMTEEWSEIYAGSGPVAKVELRLDAVIYANGTAETTNENELKGLIAGRQQNAQLHHAAANIARQVLNDKNTTDTNALLAMRDRLVSEKETYLSERLANSFTDATTPNSFKGSLVEAIIWDHNKKGEATTQRQTLQEFASDEDTITAELEKAATVKVVSK
jgi:hypothetical protein